MTEIHHKAGIVADNCKLKRFEKELTRLGLEYMIKPFTDDTSSIQVFYDTPQHLRQIERVCREVELYFKRSN